jgi:flagellar assembly protein FliH
MSDETDIRQGSASIVIPKENLTAFERWELASFDLGGGKQKAANTPVITEEELDQIRQRAHAEGYAAGQEEGRELGIQQAAADTAKLQNMMGNLQQALNQVDEQVAQSLLDLALEVARKMVHQTLQTQPEIILKVINDAIAELPHFNQNAHLILHPADAELVRQRMGEQLTHSGWKIFTDNQIERGGCKVETAHSHVDAEVGARWKKVVESIGQNKSWLA